MAPSRHDPVIAADRAHYTPDTVLCVDDIVANKTGEKMSCLHETYILAEGEIVNQLVISKVYSMSGGAI